jgi:hypothetical protein
MVVILLGMYKKIYCRRQCNRTGRMRFYFTASGLPSSRFIRCRSILNPFYRHLSSCFFRNRLYFLLMEGVRKYVKIFNHKKVYKDTQRGDTQSNDCLAHRRVPASLPLSVQPVSAATAPVNDIQAFEKDTSRCGARAIAILVHIYPPTISFPYEQDIFSPPQW